ncbi:MAG TPA: ABC transporter substrate-binding protein, partial [Methylomirabilota bacterium]|nr:ABC transporter substrate-binding protein [Methylomirabilota bacterium]
MTVRAALRLAALLLLLLAAGPARAQSPGELRVALPWTPENLDPTMNLSSIRAKVGVGIFDSLVGRDAENRITPQLAESWKALDDLTLQLKLRRGVVFHNGEPFNAEAVRFTFERVLDPSQKSPNRANVGEVARVEVVDDHTVNLVLRQPYAPLLNRLIDFPIVPPRYTAEKGNQGLALRPVGTGPFKFVELVKDDHMIVEAFDRHWRGAPKVRRIVYKPIPEPFTRAAALRNNEVDVIDTVPPNLAAELERVGGLRVQRVPSTWIIYLGLNAFNKPLSDVRVRQALNYATDVEALVKSVLDGNGRRMTGPFTPQMFGFDATVKGYGPDPARARRLLAEAGYPDGVEITLESPAGRYQGDR